MAIKKAYTTEAKLEAFLGGLAIGTTEAEDAINQAITLIDKLTGRNFVADSTESERLFNGKGKSELLIDDAVLVSEVKLGSDYYGDSKTTLASTEYIKLPNNYSVKGLPISMLHLKNNYWMTGLQNHSVKGKWGYSAVCPDDVSFATLALASGIYMFNRGGASGGVNSESIGNYSVSYESEEGWKNYKRALSILDGYKKINL